MRSKLVGLRALLVGALVLALPVVAVGQSTGLRVVVEEENFRAEPGGTRIAVLLEDATLTAGERRDRWREATLEGWVPESGVVPTDRDGRDLAIRANGTTLHAAPDGPPIARGLQGFLLDEVARRDGWIRVRRTAWVWGESVTETAAPPAAPNGPAPASSAPAGAVTAPRRAAPTPSSPAIARTLHAAPDGAELGTIEPGTPFEVIGQEGDWARVRVEGWVRLPGGGSPDPSRPIRSLTLRTLREDPDAYRGRLVAWRVQFVSVERADSLRSDLVAGEPYILARDPGGEPGYVYIAVPPALLPAARRLIPLQQVEIVGRVRTGRSALMGHPVLELVELPGGTSNGTSN